MNSLLVTIDVQTKFTTHMSVAKDLKTCSDIPEDSETEPNVSITIHNSQKSHLIKSSGIPDPAEKMNKVKASGSFYQK